MIAIGEAEAAATADTATTVVAEAVDDIGTEIIATTVETGEIPTAIADETTTVAATKIIIASADDQTAETEGEQTAETEGDQPAETDIPSDPRMSSAIDVIVAEVQGSKGVTVEAGQDPEAQVNAITTDAHEAQAL